jgi:hypothetical protein
MGLISGLSGSSRGRGRGSWDLAGAHEGAVAARGRVVRPQSRSRDRSTAGTWQRSQIHAGHRVRGGEPQATGFPPVRRPPAGGCGLQRSSSASLCAEPIVLNVPRTPLRRVFSVRRYRDTRPVYGPRLVRKFVHCAPRSSRPARCANREPLNMSQVRSPATMARRPDRTNAAPGSSHTLAPNTGAHPIFGTTDRTDGGRRVHPVRVR